MERRPNRKKYTLHGECSFYTDNGENLHAMVNKHKQKKKHYKSFRKSNKELNATIEKKLKKLIKNKKRRKTEMELHHLQKTYISDNKSKKSVSSVTESIESGEISSSSSKWNLGSDKLFVTCLNCDHKIN